MDSKTVEPQSVPILALANQLPPHICLSWYTPVIFHRISPCFILNWIDMFYVREWRKNFCLLLPSRRECYYIFRCLAIYTKKLKTAAAATKMDEQSVLTKISWTKWMFFVFLGSRIATSGGKSDEASSSIATTLLMFTSLEHLYSRCDSRLSIEGWDCTAPIKLTPSDGWESMPLRMEYMRRSIMFDYQGLWRIFGT